MRYDHDSRPFPPAPPVQQGEDLFGELYVLFCLLARLAGMWIGGFAVMMAVIFVLYKLTGH